MPHALQPEVTAPRPAQNPRGVRVAIACGGTGGHLFPGLAVAESLRDRGCHVQLLISPKEVDQQAVRAATDLEVATLPAVGLERGQWAGYLRGFGRSWRLSRHLFRDRPPAAVLAMGGFTSAPPVLAARRLGAATYLHEANAIPGRANRWLAHVVDRAFVFFLEASGRLWLDRIEVTGMPVRPQFRPEDPAACRVALGLDPRRPVLLVTGGSQGATGLNDAVVRLLPSLGLVEPELQFIHLTGAKDCDAVRQAYAANRRRALVRPFLTEMELALGSASVVLARAGASSLAELAAMRVPAMLVPYPAAADNHQFYNARAFAASGAARTFPQRELTSELLLWQVRELLRSEPVRQAMLAALATWDFPHAADRIATVILDDVAKRRPRAADQTAAAPRPGSRVVLRPANAGPHA